MAGRFPPTLRPQRSRPRSYAGATTHNGRSFLDSTATIVNEKSTLDFTQRLEKKLATYNASQNIFKRWFVELVSWTLSALCMGAVVGIYLRINGKSLAEHQMAINFVNVLGKIAAAALIVPTSEALGQLKWHWFHNSKAMWDFEIFDKASRGPWGAALLLYRTKGRSLAAFGALLIVLLLAIDTFFQQVVDYSDQWAEEKSMAAQIPKVVTYKPQYIAAYQEGIELSAEDKIIAPVMRGYFFGNGTQPVVFGNGTRPDIPLSCPTSNCTWPEYDTLAVCSSCTEVSHLLDISYSCLNTTIEWSAQWMGKVDKDLPTGLVCGTFLNATSQNPILLAGRVAETTSNISSEALLSRTVPLTDINTKSPLYGYGSISYRDVRYPLLDALISSVPNGMDSIHSQDAPIIHECMLFWCVQRIRSTYEWGRYAENITARNYAIPKRGDQWPWYTYETGLGTFIVYTQDITLESAQPTIESLDEGLKTMTAYEVDNITMANVVNVFDDIFPSLFTQTSKGDRLLRFKNFAGLAPIVRGLDFNPWLAPNNISRHMDRLATSVTNTVRSSTSKVMISGTAYSMKTFIAVKWEWLIFPFALLLLTLAFLASTMLKTSKDMAAGVWKTSAMPSLIYSLPEETRGKLTASSSWGTSHADTKKIRVKLLPSLGWRVSGQDILSSPLLPVKRDQPPSAWI